MYCANCGRKHDGGKFCMYCGKEITPGTYTSSAPAPAARKTNKKALLAVIGAAAVVLTVVLVVMLSKPGDRYPIPYYSDPYTNTQEFVPPPLDFSDDYDNYYDDDSYNYDDSYDYGNASFTCPSCHGSGTCPICNGTGQYSMYGNELSTCTACYGTGICSICDGDGVG